MGKRFTDTALWNRPWFRKLSPVEKCAYFFIKDFCDNVGVWVPDYEVEDFYIKGKVDWDLLKKHCNSNIVVLENGKWFLPDFCDFQYGELSESCKPHKSYIDLLKKHGLFKGYPKGIHTLQEKEKEKELEKELEKEKEKSKKYTDDFERFWAEYPRNTNKQGAYKAWQARVKEGVTSDLLLKCAKNYKKSVAGTEVRFIMHAATFLGPNERYKDFEAVRDEKKVAVKAVQYPEWECECGNRWQSTSNFCSRCGKTGTRKKS